jgi:hypothetical protein
MTAKSANVAQHIQALEGEESMIEAAKRSARYLTPGPDNHSCCPKRIGCFCPDTKDDASHRDVMRTVLLSFRNLQVKD